MCGIAGQFLLHRDADAAEIRAMCDAIRHRGPDDEGVRTEGGCGIGMRRLSIIDLSTGHQPLSNEDGSVWVVFNGEIYNYQTLRQELIGKGHRFRTNSDTETLVHLYEEEGVGGLHKLRGMFAFAIHDARRRCLLLVRDRFGKKPLHYALLRDGLYFGSELKCLRVAGVPLEIDREALQLYFQFTWIPEPWSVYKAIRKLPPGSWMRYHADGRVEQGRYWTMPQAAEEPPPGLTIDAACEELRSIFDESVRLRMIADVPLGAFLSGGIDSTSVVASMSRQSSAPVKTFSIGFDEPEFNELPWAGQVAKQYNTEHHEIIVRPNSVDLVTKLVRSFDEPFGDSSAIPTYLVSEFAAQHVKVALTGDGGDELFAGYNSFFQVQAGRRYDAIPQVARRLMSWTADRLPYSAYGKNLLRAVSRPSALERYFEWAGTMHFFRERLLAAEWMEPADASYLRSTLGHYLLPESTDPLTQALWFEATAKLTGDMLVKVDRMSMANSLEVRCPLLDHELAEFAARLPHSWKMREGRGKWILVKALGDRLPPELLTRPKWGFGVPVAQWFRGSLREFLRDHLLSPGFLNRGVVSPPFLRHLIEEHESGRRNNRHRLWMLLMLELWFREHDGNVAALPSISNEKRPEAFPDQFRRGQGL